MQFRYFETGQVFHGPSHTLSEEEVLSFARTYDPQWFHTDPERAAKGPYGGVIASGWQTCAIAMKLVGESLLVNSEGVASPGMAPARWLAPVRPGDTLTLRVTVTGKRLSSSKPHLGLLTWQWDLFNQEGVQVIALEPTTLFDLRLTPTLDDTPPLSDQPQA